jgi:hypothetical protein
MVLIQLIRILCYHIAQILIVSHHRRFKSVRLQKMVSSYKINHDEIAYLLNVSLPVLIFIFIPGEITNP